MTAPVTIMKRVSETELNNLTGEELSASLAPATSSAQGAISASDKAKLDAFSTASNYQLVAAKNQANGYAGLDSSGKLLSAQLPALAIGETFIVNSEVSMLALDAQPGDLAIRTDEHRSYILQGEDPSELESWVEVLAPLAAVSSVAGRTGDVVLSHSDISGLGTAALLDVPATGDAASGQVVKGSDTRLTNARTPTSHAASHLAVGSDPVFGLVPIGGVVAWHKSYGTDPVLTPSLPADWRETNGQSVSDVASPYNGTNLPDLNDSANAGANGKFIRGKTSSGGTGGSLSHSHSLSISHSTSPSLSLSVSTTTIHDGGGSSISVVTGVNVSSLSVGLTISGNVQPTTVLPGYFELVYIMRIK